MADLAFIGSYGQGYPEKFDGILNSTSAAVAVVCSFNRPGTLLAVGCNDGRVIVWDIMTKNVLKSLTIHVHPITSICWSRYGHTLLVGSSDWSVTIVDVGNFIAQKSYQFTSPVTNVEFHPRKNNIFIVCLQRDMPHIIWRDSEKRLILSDPEISQVEKSVMARFDRRGDYIFFENGHGKVLVFKSESLEIVQTFILRTHTATLTSAIAFEFSHRGRDDFLINCYDRSIRLYRWNDVFNTASVVEPIQRFRDLVNKSLWKKCCFSNDGEYVVAGASRQHSLYIWERNTGGLVKILNGTKGEILRDLTWHPIRSSIYSISSGTISIWNNTSIECWSAYAPNFKELEENIEYEEKEDEFDIEDEDKKQLDTHKRVNEPDYSSFVDVITPDKPLYCSSDEDGSEEHINSLFIAADDIYADRGEVSSDNINAN